MNYRNLGKSAMPVSEISIGCMSLGADEAENARIIGRAIDSGINYFDTADIYQNGMNETNVGRILKSRRSKVILATKAGNQLRPDGSGLDWNPRKEHILAAAEKSLVRLQTDYIDLYQLHGGTMEDPIDETIEAFEILKQQGKIRFYGISSIRPNVIREWVSRSNITSVMMQYNLLDRRPEESCLSLLLEHNIGVLARGSLAQGLLVNKAAKKFLQYEEADVQQAAAAIRALSGEHRSPSQTAIRFVLQHPAITSAVVGCRTIEQLEDAAATTGTPLLHESDLQALRNSVQVNHYEQHR